MRVIDDKTVTETPAVAASESAAPARLPIVEREVYLRGAEIAVGGMGRIVEARDGRLGRTVALKEIRDPNPALVRRFEREALISAALEHPAIVAVYEAGRWPNGEPFYAMKRVIGRPLDKVIADCSTLAERLALIPNVLAVFDALAYAHGKKIIHRDLKPANVLVGAYGETVVIDWGLAKDLREADEALEARDNDSTVLGAVLGTPAYMPPEQARGERVDERADVYALGALLYNVLAGRPPYVGFSTQMILDAVKTKPVARLRDVPEDLATIVEHAMARDADGRYATASQLAEDLRRFQTGQLVGKHTYTLGELLRRWIKKHRAALTVATAMLVVSGIALGLAFRATVRSRDRAEAEAWATREAQAAQIIEHAHTMLPIDPSETLATLDTLPPDASADAYAAAWPLAVAAASAPRVRPLFRSPGAAYAWLGYTGDGALLGLRPVEESVFVVDRFRDGVVTTDTTKLELGGITAVSGTHALITSQDTCEELDVATRERTRCAVPPSVTFDSTTHQITTIGPRGERHVHPIEANVGGHGVGFETNLVLAPDGSSFILGINSGQRITIISDIELAKFTILPDQLVAAAYLERSDPEDPQEAMVVTAGGVIVVQPNDPIHINQSTTWLEKAKLAVHSADGKRIAVAFARAVMVFDTKSVAALASAPVPQDIGALALSPDGERVTVALADRSVRVLTEIGMQAGVGTYEGFVVEGDRAMYSSTGKHINVTGDAQGEPLRSAILVHPREMIITILAKTNGSPGALAFSGDIGALVIDDRLFRFDLARGSLTAIDTPTLPTALAVSPDGKTLLGRSGRDLLVWRGGRFEVMKETLGAVRGDGTLVLARATSLTIGDRTETLGCTASALATRGSRVAVGCTNGQVRVIGEGALASVLAPSPVVSLDISEDGSIAAAGADPAIQVWTGAAIPIVLRGPNRGTTFLQWANHGRVLVSAIPNQTWVWDPRHGIGAPLTEIDRILLGDDFFIELQVKPRWRPLPTRTPIGFHAWLQAQTR